MYWILVAIDGTGSADSRKPDGSNSAVYKFHQDFKTPGLLKAYFDGPIATVTDFEMGTNTADILVYAMNFLSNTWLYCYRKISDDLLLINDLAERKRKIVEQIKICLVGHSRGGLIAIELAKRFPSQRINFMGLYDAVDRQPFFDGSLITNVDVVYHALRNPDAHSRSFFSNTGLTVGTDVKQYYHQMFFTSHGGIGGDSNFYLSELADTASIQYGTERMVDTLFVKASALIKHPTEGIFKSESMRADSWIRDGAQNAGLPIGNYCS